MHNAQASLIYHVSIQIKLLCPRALGHKRQLCFIAPSKGAAVLVEHEASAELDDVDDDYMEGAKNLIGPLPHSHAIHANDALNRVISTTWRTNRVPSWHMLGSQEVLNEIKIREDKTQRKLVMRVRSAAAAPLPRASRCGRSRELLQLEEGS